MRRTLFPTTIRIQRVHATAAKAKALGELTEPSHCTDCGKAAKLDMHHVDYSKPLDVVWLCRRCHGRRHASFVLPVGQQIETPVTMRLPRQLWKAVKRQALNDDVPAVRVVEQALRAYLKAPKVAALMGVGVTKR